MSDKPNPSKTSLPKSLNLEDKKTIITEIGSKLPESYLLKLLEIIMNNEDNSLIQRLANGCAINLSQLQDITIENLFDVVMSIRKTKK